VKKVLNPKILTWIVLLAGISRKMVPSVGESVLVLLVVQDTGNYMQKI
jgi:hypothetical protein